MTTIRAVIFDIGNVLLEWDPDKLFTKVIPDPEARAQFYAEAETDSMNLDIDRGAPFQARVNAQAERFPEHAENLQIWHDRWIDMIGPEISGSVSLLHALRADQVPVFALSNFGTETFDIAQKVFPFLSSFDRRYISGPMGMVKPDADIYAAVEADCGFSGAELVFIDDREDNIAAAIDRGWYGICYRNPEFLKQELWKLGLLKHN